MDRVVKSGFCLLVLVVSVQARNLPKSDPSPKMEACGDMGPGFFKVEGSETCVKLSGNARVEFGKQSGGAVFIPSQR